jgi:hypothetical protein
MLENNRVGINGVFSERNLPLVAPKTASGNYFKTEVTETDEMMAPSILRVD